ncbi:MAG: VCBS repeat-containing protein [Pseudomonadota bacterium]
MTHNPASHRLARAALAALAVFALATGAARAAFDEVVIDAGFVVDHALLHGRFDRDDNRFVVVAGHDEDFTQHVALYRVDGSGAAPRRLAALNPGAELVAYDVGRIGDRDVLAFLAPGRLLRFDPATQSVTELLAVDSLYGQERTAGIVPLDFLRDLNDDGLDDLLVPDLAGHRVRLQLPGGGFGDEVLLEQSVAMKLGESGARFEPRALHVADSNFDGLSDIVTWRGDAFHIYRQRSDHRFDSEPLVQPLGLGLPTEAQLRALDLDRGAVDQSKLTTRRIWTVADFNGDELLDVLTEARLSEGVFDKRNTFAVHFGRRDGDRLSYSATEDARLNSKGLQFGLVNTDLDGDGRKDVIVRKVKLNLGRVIGAMLSGSVSLQIEFFKMTGDERFAERADFETKTKVKFSMSSGQIDIPVVRVADFNGDGRQDLALETRKEKLAVYDGVAGDALFAEAALELDVPLPRNGELVEATDLNGDERADLVVRYTVADGDAAARTVRLLLSTPPLP